MKSPVVLRIFKNDQLVEVKQFDQEQIIIGHDAEVNLDLPDESISPIHCLLELRPSGYYVCDLGSKSGTFKNGKQILDEPVTSGESIQIGVYRLQFFVAAKSKAIPTLSVTSPVDGSGPDDDENEVPVPTPTFVPAKPPPPTPSTPVQKPPVLAEATTFHPASKSVTRSQSVRTDADLKKYLKPTKGTHLQVIVTWQDRVLNTYHFSAEKNITAGPKAADIFIPQTFLRDNYNFIEFKNGCKVALTIDMSPEVITSSGTANLDDLLRLGKAIRTTTGQSIRVDQGDLLCITMGNLSIYVRYTPAVQKPLLAPFLDFTAGELTGIVVSLVIVSLVLLYMTVYKPEPVEPPKDEERVAQFIFDKKIPPPPPPPVVTPVEVKPVPPEPEKPKPLVVKKENLAEQSKKQEVKGVSDSNEEGRAGSSAARGTPKAAKVDRPKKFNVKQGGAVKTTDSAAANAKSKDVNKMGLLSAFGGGGARTKLDQAYNGSGELLGEANQATGKTGQNQNRAGDDIGGKLVDVGAGGNGNATQGISGLGTKGRGGGQSNYGNGVGLGGKGNMQISAGGSDEGFEGSIDREAVRRVIRRGLPQIKSCYERELRTNSALEGKVIIEFEIEAQGHVKSARVSSSSIDDPQVGNCIASRLKEWIFPEPPVGLVVKVLYPFVFNAQK